MRYQYVPPDYGRLMSSEEDASLVWLNEALGVAFKVQSEETGNALAIVEQPLNPEALASPVHVHYNEDEISYVLEGEITLQLGEQVIRAPQGTMVFKPRGIPHTFWNQTKRKARLLQIFTPGGFEKYFQEVARLGSDGEQLSALAERYQLELQPASKPGLMERYHLKLVGSA